ncbi:hypothetical protein CAPTEDRAFT_185181 [Capitella teleta]|uniref:SSD domain-containing protein n=1 Tax=Capitella teleta TaxID=283909 RepID=R7U147_CAPTE|nr:hypothetical protein CAPTEDRAFT_185181 [Capitella teleta]|eukprot:ELT97356.1 hypothetical protein CAPTEDRAFT_185181 [Capitella teleta]
MSEVGYANPAFNADGEAKAENGLPQPAVNGTAPAPTKELSEVEAAQKAKREKDPLFICKIMASYPKTTFGVTLGLHIMMLFITAVLVRIGYDILPISFDQLPLNILDDDDFLRGLAWSKRDEETGIIVRGLSEDNTESPRSVPADFLQLNFREKGGNVFTQENLKKIKQVEDDFFNDADFQAKYCKLRAAGGCSKPSSILRYFDGSYAVLNPLFNDPNFDNIVKVINLANEDDRFKVQLQSFLGRNYVINNDTAQSEITSSLMQFGFPLDGFANTTDNEDEQQKKLQDFMRKSFLTKGNEYFESGVGAMEFCYSSITLIILFITSQVFMDMALAIGSMIFIAVFICVQTGSIWVGLWSVFSIFASFVGANIVYRCFLDFRYFGIFHVLAVFIILGIGADDVFVFFDNWKGTGHHEYPSVAHRLSDCYRKASVAMLFTSLTTAIAFICSASSPFLGISSFGVFAGILVGVNYLSVILFIPTVVVTYHLYWEKYKCCCCCPREAMVHAAGDREIPPPGMPVQRKNFVVRFFRGPYFEFITHKVIRWVILALIGVILAIFIYYATLLEVNDEDTKFLPDDSNMGKFLSWRANLFSFGGSSNDQVQVRLVWGLKNQDLSECHKSDPDCFGKTVWDEDFSLNTQESQDALLTLCQKIRDLDVETIKNLRIKESLLDGKPEVDCFIENMKTFYEGKTEGGVPFLETQANEVMTGDPKIYQKPIADATGYLDWFTVGMSYWLHNGFVQVTNTADPMLKFGELLGEVPDGVHTQSVTTPADRLGRSIMYDYGTKLRYISITVNTTLRSSTLAYEEGLPIRDNWEEWMKEQVKTLPDSLKGGFQATARDDRYAWHSLKVQKKLVSTAVMGIMVGLCCALPILIIATHNIITGLLATFSICCVITCVIGVIPMAGWKLGMLESLNLVLVVGLSVDYVVHLAEGYSRSLHTDRLGRLHDMLEEVGISIVSGAFTTLGASFFLLFAQILFFTQFGLFMFSTIGLSLLFACIFFSTIMGVIGPQNESHLLRNNW